MFSLWKLQKIHWIEFMDLTMCLAAFDLTQIHDHFSSSLLITNHLKMIVD